MISAYLQVYKNEKKINFVIENFRKLYPDTYFCLISDNGNDLKDISIKYNCDYLYRNVNTGANSWGHSQQEALEWFSRFLFACSKSNTEYLLYMEDDVLVRNRIIVNPLWRIAGVSENPIHPSIEQFSILKYKNNFNTNLYGACGGTIYHVPTVLIIANFITDFIKKEYNTIQQLSGGRFGFLDAYMPSLFMMAGYNYELNTQLTESHRNPNWKSSEHPIVHGKEIYTYFNE